jgi:hypothetical protein
MRLVGASGASLSDCVVSVVLNTLLESLIRFTSPGISGTGTDSAIAATGATSVSVSDNLDFVRTVIERCDKPFTEMPRPDYELP